MDLNQLLSMADSVVEPFPEHLAETTPDVRKRLRALKKLQIEALKVEAAFYDRIQQLEKEFQPYYDALSQKRTAVVTGQLEPTDQDCELPLLANLEENELKELEEKWNSENAGKAPVTGIPQFWLHTLKQVSGIAELIQEQDEPLLKHLVDVTCSLENSVYKLDFHFSPNEYFTNTVLTKTYETSNVVDEKSPFEYDGPNVIGCKGTEIQWKEGKQIALAESVFKFFYPQVTSIPKDDDADADEKSEALQEDFELGQLIRDSVIPRAVLYYTGEMGDDDEFDPDEDFEDDDCESCEEEDSDVDIMEE